MAQLTRRPGEDRTSSGNTRGPGPRDWTRAWSRLGRPAGTREAPRWPSRLGLVVGTEERDAYHPGPECKTMRRVTSRAPHWGPGPHCDRLAPGQVDRHLTMARGHRKARAGEGETQHRGASLSGLAVARKLRRTPFGTRQPTAHLGLLLPLVLQRRPGRGRDSPPATRRAVTSQALPMGPRPSGRQPRRTRCQHRRCC